MPDLLRKLHHHPATAWLARAAGLPDPVELLRAAGPTDAQPLAGKRTAIRAAAGGYAADDLRAFALGAGAVIDDLQGQSLDILIFDATGCRTPAGYAALYDTFHAAASQIAQNGRVLLVAAPPAAATDPIAAAAARGIEGFSRSLGKELGKKGITVNLAYVAADALDRLDGPLRFFCGARSTYVSGQAVQLSTTAVARGTAIEGLHGKVAIVTGSARGIGMATAQRLVEEGATVVCVDVPAASQALHDTCRAIGATALVLDIAAADAPARLLDFLRERGGVDIVVYNAGITRDRTLARMARRDWDLVVDVNFGAIAAIDEALLAAQLLREGGRVICLSSISGVAGNFGQSNYAATKAALIGYVAARGAQLGARGITVNAVAPGFIETPMTQRMPFVPRELGRRLNSLKQGGQPRDVAELIAFLAAPGSVGITGNTIRVCGQALIGA
ncbi:3-oxoacyl-ACP reductase [Pseudoduganella armeniaca]|uniref:3-oxoacyl-ACP reductase n=1 Tax=Pseudoduganella armeniaca TaxID=2072590 RepID=A0A2R4C809_9BURK|nr:3-oxoacyl-ACP reductase [Pseudoduganella armeniaca]AVR95759.1 3-oxoacyl-ACP reductase [Pseudoduganella armeniaca]